jgi:hypothetical protein
VVGARRFHFFYWLTRFTILRWLGVSGIVDTGRLVQVSLFILLPAEPEEMVEVLMFSLDLGGHVCIAGVNNIARGALKPQVEVREIGAV